MNECLNKLWYIHTIYPYHLSLLRKKKEQTFDNNLDEFQANHINNKIQSPKIVWIPILHIIGFHSNDTLGPSPTLVGGNRASSPPAASACRSTGTRSGVPPLPRESDRASARLAVPKTPEHAPGPRHQRRVVMVLEKTLESPLDSKIKPVNPKGNQP